MYEPRNGERLHRTRYDYFKVHSQKLAAILLLLTGSLLHIAHGIGNDEDEQTEERNNNKKIYIYTYSFDRKTKKLRESEKNLHNLILLFIFSLVFFLHTSLLLVLFFPFNNFFLCVI